MATGRGIHIAKTDVLIVPSEMDVDRSITVDKASLVVAYDEELAPHVDDIVGRYRERRTVKVTRSERGGAVVEGGPELFEEPEGDAS